MRAFSPLYVHAFQHETGLRMNFIDNSTIGSHERKNDDLKKVIWAEKLCAIVLTARTKINNSGHVRHNVGLDGGWIFVNYSPSCRLF